MKKKEKKTGKRFVLISHFSLVKQLLIVFGILAVAFVVVVMPVLDSNIKGIIAGQMYDTLKASQQEMRGFTFDPNISTRGKRVNHIFYKSSEHSFVYVSYNDDTVSLNLYQYVFGNDLKKITKDSKHATIENKGEYQGKTYYYRIVRQKNTQFGTDYIISIISDNYSTSLLDAMTTRIVYIQYIFLGVTAAILIIWVMSLIRPLNRIKNYVDAIKNREEAHLDLKREDEIGIVGNAIVDMNEEIKKQEKAKEEMIHNISHDLKTPIALIKNYAQAVKDDVYPYGDKDSTIDVIIENADRLEHKVKRLLYLNRLDYVESEEITYSEFNMKELIEHTMSQMQTMNHFTIEMDLDDVNFIGNPDHWRVVVENIIDNATRYAKSLIKITLRKDSLVIYNDGEPIEADQIKDLFDPYVKGVKGQFGLGLSIVAKTADMYGYSVKAENEDPGVAFIFKKEFNRKNEKSLS